MTERFGRPGELRKAVQQAAGLILRREIPDSSESTRVEDMLAEGNIWPETWLQKGDRYAQAGPLIKIMANHMVDGHGWGARFRDAPMPTTDFELKLTSPRNQVLAGTRRLFIDAARAFKAAHGAHTELMSKYTELSVGLDKDQNITTGEGLVAGGGDYPYSIFEYVSVAADLMDGDQQLATLSAEGRRDFAHQLLPLAMGRHASMHQEDFVSTPVLEDLHRAGRVTLQQKQPGEYSLDTDGALRAAASTASKETRTTPTLTCPANMEFEGEPETAFQTFVHAGINYAYDLGVFGAPEPR
jgi:hypothetical protein